MSFIYNNRRLLWKTTDALSRVTELTYDAKMRVSTVKDPSLTVAETRVYTDNGLLESVEDASGNVTEYEFDGFDRLKKTTFEDATYTQRTYDANGNVTQFRTRNADLVDFTFDVLNRVTEKDPDGMPTVTYSYDLAGRRTQVSTPVVSGNPASGDFDYSFDTAGRMIGEEYPDSKDVDYELDENGNITKLTYPDGFYVEYVYDKLNRLTDIKLDGATTSAAAFEFSKLSQRTKLTYENGVVTDYGFELDGDMDSLEHTFSGSSVAFTYAFNNNHELTSQSVDDSGFLWHPASAGTVSYGTANAMNQYPTVGGTSQTYNNNGCLTDDGTFDFTYDTENQLVEADDGSTVSAYIYDPMRRQNQKDVGGTKTRYIYSGVQLIAEYDGSGNIQKKYVYGAGLDEALIELDAVDDPTYLHHDQIGSVIATTDDTGAVLNTYAYSPFGECSSLSGTTFGFTGQRFDPETGLYYYKNRHYSTEVGRFLQPDPLGYVDGLNSYQYAFNDPLGFTDPLGLQGGQGAGSPWGDGTYAWGNNGTWGDGSMGWGNNHYGYGWSSSPGGWAPSWAGNDTYAQDRAFAEAIAAENNGAPNILAAYVHKGSVEYNEPGMSRPNADPWSVVSNWFGIGWIYYVNDYSQKFASVNNQKSEIESPFVNKVRHTYAPALLAKQYGSWSGVWIELGGQIWEGLEFIAFFTPIHTPWTAEGVKDYQTDTYNNHRGVVLGLAAQQGNWSNKTLLNTIVNGK